MLIISLRRTTSIAAAGNQLHIVWFDGRDGKTEIYYKHSPDGGKTWESDARLTFAQGNANRPSVAAAGDFLHLLWADERDGSSQIYYKRKRN